jgi:cellobiose dehydrogenase (acceptor)
MASYLVSASSRTNFKLWTNTTVNRVIRSGSTITGVEVEAYGAGGYCGVVNVTSGTGRVVLSAGTFGTPKILFRSGIGPTDMLTVVNASSQVADMVPQSDWITLPVGHNVQDHQNVGIGTMSLEKIC